MSALKTHQAVTTIPNPFLHYRTILWKIAHFLFCLPLLNWVFKTHPRGRKASLSLSRRSPHSHRQWRRRRRRRRRSHQFLHHEKLFSCVWNYWHASWFLSDVAKKGEWSENEYEYDVLHLGLISISSTTAAAAASSSSWPSGAGATFKVFSLSQSESQASRWMFTFNNMWKFANHQQHVKFASVILTWDKVSGS